MTYKNILYESAGPVTTITINRPQRLNALTVDTVNELIGAMGRANTDSEVRVVVLTGAGTAFCAGADLKEAPEMTGAIAYEIVGLYLDLVRAIRAVDKPVVARVNGVAVGGGCCIALASDIRVAADTASFGMAFVNIGISGADMGATYLLPRLVGYGRAAQILMLGATVDALEADRIGLVNRTVPQAELDATVDAMVKRLASRPPAGLAYTKRALYGGLDADWESELNYEHLVQAKCLLSDDYQEGRRAFMEKREPVFRGR